VAQGVVAYQARARGNTCEWISSSMRLKNQPPKPINGQGFHLQPRIMRLYWACLPDGPKNALRPGEASLGASKIVAFPVSAWLR